MAELSLTAALLIAWTVVLRVFPSILGKALEKRIEHGYDSKLEGIKAELQASYSTLKTSVDFLSATQPELRTKMITATETLWGAVCAARKEFADIAVVDFLMTQNKSDKSLQMLKPYRDSRFTTAKLARVEALESGSERLFVSARLWLIYSTILLVYCRSGAHIAESLEQHRDINWKDDHTINSLLGSCLPTTVIDSAKGGMSIEFGLVIGHLESEFLKEATRVMSGSQGLADSLSDIHSVLQYQNQQIAFRSARLSEKYSEGS